MKEFILGAYTWVVFGIGIAITLTYLDKKYKKEIKQLKKII